MRWSVIVSDTSLLQVAVTAAFTSALAMLAGQT